MDSPLINMSMYTPEWSPSQFCCIILFCMHVEMDLQAQPMQDLLQKCHRAPGIFAFFACMLTWMRKPSSLEFSCRIYRLSRDSLQV